MDRTKITLVINTLSQIYGETPMEQAFGDNPFQFLAAVMLSARSRDSVTIPVAREIFDLAPNPAEISRLPTLSLEKMLYRIGFYHTKAKYLLGMAKIISTKYQNKIPETYESLTTLPGVSRKVANVVLSQIFEEQVIAVDTHVHRIGNRLGWITSKTPIESERKLMEVIPRKYWRKLNQILVQHGQQICLPRYPKCQTCPVKEWCPRIGL